MAQIHMLETQQSQPRLPTGPAVAGSWKLAARHAITLRPEAAGHLRVTHGGLWLTDGRGGEDRFLQPGARIELTAGTHIVIEPWNPADRHAASWFAWEPQGAPKRQAALRGQPAIGREWDQLAHSLHQVHAALAVALHAAGRLAVALALGGARAAAAWVTPAAGAGHATRC